MRQLLFSLFLIHSLPAFGLTFSQSPLNLPQSPPANLLFSLSVEHPTGNSAAYATSSFSTTTLYDGYFDSNKCYNYVVTNATPTGAISSSQPNEYFQPVFMTSASINYSCNQSGTRAWSGNFLNWLTMTKLDIFRKSLTGGAREFDTATQTFLLRSFIDGHSATSVFPDVTVGSTNVTKYTPLVPIQSYKIANFSISNYGQSCRSGCNASELYGSRFRIIDPTNANESTDVQSGTITFPNNILKVSVLVCDPSVGLESNCKPYISNGSTTFKPEGLIQKNQSVRYGVFSYAPVDYLDQREGGMLREPLKNVGLQSYVGVNQFQDNTLPEIDPTTGVFLFDPDGLYTQAPKSTSVVAPIYQLAQLNWNNSGLINYINQFGYKSVPSLGGWHYIKFDNPAELYYETVRYLSLAYNGTTQNATPEYTKNIKTGQPFSSTVSDGFPLLTQYNDPIVDKCQSNYVVFLSDANNFCDGRIPGGVIYSGQAGSSASSGQCANTNATLSNPIPNLYVLDWIYKLEGYESGYSDIDYNSSNLMNCPGGARGCFTSSTPNIAGLAYWAHVNDIRSDLNGFQSVTTYVMDVHENTNRAQNGTAPYAFGQDPTNLWLAAKYGGFIYNDSTNWNKNPNANNLTWSSNNDGVPDTFLKGDSASNMQASLQKLFSKLVSDNIYKGNGRIAVSLPLIPQNTKIYQAYYANPSYGQWEGNVLMASPTYSSIGNTVTYNVEGAVNFNQGAAGWLLDSTVAGQTPRQIIASVPSPTGASLVGAAFQWDNIGSSTQALFKNNNDSDALGELRLNYVRGDRSNEVSSSNPTGFRARPSTVLGDIINSSPVYVSSVMAGYSDSDFPLGTPPFTGFAKLVSSRLPMVYVGANDGMLHGFDGNTLKEVFAFIPNSVLENLKNFSSTSYAHNYFVDETPLVVDVPLPVRGWTTQLIGFPGMGGTGLFALDITSPDTTRPDVNLSEAETNASNIVLWELNSKTDGDIGYILNRGQINRQFNGVTMQVGRMSNNRWAVITGNGYKSPNNSTGLLVVFLDSANGVPSYKKVMIQGATGGLSTPTSVDIDRDGIIDYAYAGDLSGNVWRFNLQGNPNTWSAFKLFTAIDTNNGWGGSGTNRPQPIGTAPAVAASCSGGGVMVYVGTGTYFDVNDNSISSQGQSLYALSDKLDTTPISKSQLVVQMYDHWAVVNGKAQSNLSTNIGFTTNNPVDWSIVRGWEWDSIGDKIVTPPYVVNGLVYFTSIIPLAAVATNACTSSGLWNNFFVLNACTGGSPSKNTIDHFYHGKVDNDGMINGKVFSQLSDAWSKTKADTNYIDSSAWINPAAFACTTPPCLPLSTGYISGVGVGVDLGYGPPKRKSWTQILQ